MGKHDNWQTPPDLFDALHREFQFGLDAACDTGHLGLPYITKDQDALVTPWEYDRTYVNPPYSMLPAFIERAAHQSREQESTVVMLIPVYTDTKVWHSTILHHADEVRFLKGRLSFWEDGHKGKDTARFSSAVVIFRPTGGSLSNCTLRFWDWRSA